MLVDTSTYGKQLEAYRRWIMGSAIAVVKARNASVPATRISVDAFEVMEFEIELAHVGILLLSDTEVPWFVRFIYVYCILESGEIAVGCYT
jgi:hypothetical protein